MRESGQLAVCSCTPRIHADQPWDLGGSDLDSGSRWQPRAVFPPLPGSVQLSPGSELRDAPRHGAWRGGPPAIGTCVCTLLPPSRPSRCCHPRSAARLLAPPHPAQPPPSLTAAHRRPRPTPTRLGSSVAACLPVPFRLTVPRHRACLPKDPRATCPARHGAAGRVCGRPCCCGGGCCCCRPAVVCCVDGVSVRCDAFLFALGLVSAPYRQARPLCAGSLQSICWLLVLETCVPVD